MIVLVPRCVIRAKLMELRKGCKLPTLSRLGCCGAHRFGALLIDTIVICEPKTHHHPGH